MKIICFFSVLLALAAIYSSFWALYNVESMKNSGIIESKLGSDALKEYNRIVEYNLVMNSIIIFMSVVILGLWYMIFTTKKYIKHVKYIFLLNILLGFGLLVMHNYMKVNLGQLINVVFSNIDFSSEPTTVPA